MRKGLGPNRENRWLGEKSTSAASGQPTRDETGDIASPLSFFDSALETCRHQSDGDPGWVPEEVSEEKLHHPSGKTGDSDDMCNGDTNEGLDVGFHHQ